MQRVLPARLNVGQHSRRQTAGIRGPRSHSQSATPPPRHATMPESGGRQPISMSREVRLPIRHPLRMPRAPQTPITCSETGMATATTLPPIDVLHRIPRKSHKSGNAAPLERIGSLVQGRRSRPPRSSVVKDRRGHAIQQSPLLSSTQCLPRGAMEVAAHVTRRPALGGERLQNTASHRSPA